MTPPWATPLGELSTELLQDFFHGLSVPVCSRGVDHKDGPLQADSINRMLRWAPFHPVQRPSAERHHPVF